MKDYYRILEFKSNRVDLEQIKTSYRELAKKYHPDLNIGNPKAEERFKDINEAYRVLTDSNSRRKYDRMWNSYIGNKKTKEEKEEQGNNINNSFFSILFGNVKEEEPKKIAKKKVAAKGDNVETEINISIEEAFRGVEKKIALRTVEGEMKTFQIKVPAGIHNNEKIRLIGQGKAGKNGGKNGDLFIKINITSSKKFKLEGYEIITPMYLTPWEAVLGTKISVDGIDDTYTVHIPAGIQSGQRIVIENKGYKDGKGGRGNLIAEAQIMVPTKLTEKEKDLFTKMKQISKFSPRTSEEHINS